MTLKVIPFTPVHARMIALNEGYDPSVLANYSNMQGFLVETIVLDRGFGRTFEVLAVFSGCMVMQGNFEISALVSKDAKEVPIQFVKFAKKRLAHYENVLGLRRTQCTVRAGFPFLIKFIELLGFEREGLLRKFGPEGDDYFIYARVKA